MKVKFLPQDVEYEIELNESVLHLAQRHDIHIQSVCKGLPSCAECRIQIKSGEHNVPPPGTKELNLIGTAYYVDQSRLSCQLRCFGDVVVDLSEQIEKEKRAKERPTVGPSGRQIAANKESHAVKGSIIEEEFKDDSTVVTQIDPREERPGHDNFYDSFSKENKPQQGNNRNQQGQGRNQHGRNQQGRNRNAQGGGGQNQQGQNRNPQGGNRNQQAQGNSQPRNQQKNKQHRNNNPNNNQNRNQNRNQQAGPAAPIASPKQEDPKS